jgi:hypothetical protein
MRVLESPMQWNQEPALLGQHQVVLVASGDLRPAANQMCWPG